MKARLRRGATHQRRSCLKLRRERGCERAPPNTNGQVSSQMDHQISSHQRGGKREEREPRRFDSTHRQHHRAIRANRKEFTLAVHIDLQILHDSTRSLQPDHVCSRDKKEPPRPIRFPGGLPDRINQNWRTAVFIETEKPKSGGLSLNRQRRFLHGRINIPTRAATAFSFVRSAV